jgi:Rrf2 family nitric oxide-sensitive transcriptional repressor
MIHIYWFFNEQCMARRLSRNMRLTTYTDYTLRTLMYLGLNRERFVTIQDIADLHGISKNHLMKVVYQLGLSGMIETVRGRNGGVRLNREPKDINIGAVVRNTELDFHMAVCFDGGEAACAYAPGCVLKGVLGAATAAYLAVLDGVTLDDLIKNDPSRPQRRSALKQMKFHP